MNVIQSVLIGMCSLLVLLTALPSSASADAEREKNYEIAVTKGTLMIESGNYAEAVLLLKKALEAKPGDKAATQGLGIAYSRGGNFRSAKEVLLKAFAMDPADWRTRYELGVVSFSLGESDAAKKYFRAVAEGSDDDALVAGAKRYLDLISAAAQGTPRRFQLNVLAGLQYDTNVILEPSVPIGSQDQKADWSAVASAGILYPFLSDKDASAEAGYTFYQSIHRTLHDFNVQQHTLSANGRMSTGASAQTGIGYQYTFTTMGGDRYSAVHRLVPAVTIRTAPSHALEIFYAYESRTYSNGDLFPRNSDRSGSDHAAGATYRADLSRTLSLHAGYTYDRDSAAEAWWSSTGSKAAVGADGEAGGIKAAAAFSICDQKYNEPAPGFTGKRHDRMQEFSLSLMKEFTKRFSLLVSELYVRNRSNIAPADYTRNIAGVFVVLSL